jgi:hypothetical protein
MEEEAPKKGDSDETKKWQVRRVPVPDLFLYWGLVVLKVPP